MYEQPDSFLPARFEGKSRTEVELPIFSLGVHKCPGRVYAYHLMQTIISELLASYSLELCGHLPPFDFEKATLAQRLGKCRLRFRQRC
eukprot:1693801-Amphidinium_carterae.1